MKKFLAFLLIFFLLSSPVLASVKISAIFPNPETNAKKNEFVELQNLGCEPVDLSKFALKKEATKNPIFLNGELKPGESKKFYRDNGGLTLKDDDDTIFLVNADGDVIDEVQYTKNDAKKGNILTFSHDADQCDTDEENDDPQNPPNTNNENTDSESDSKNETNHDENQENPEENLPENEEKILANELLLEDLDEDGFFETMKIVYPENLTGSLNIEDFSLMSVSEAGQNKIPNSVLSGALADDTIILTLTGIITTENIFSISEKKNTGIFLKSENISNILSIESKKLEQLDEHSFEKYTKITF